MSAGVPEDRITFLPDEMQALTLGIGMSSEDDIFVVIVDKVQQTLNTVRDLLAASATP
jgi:hypothetical protein